MRVHYKLSAYAKADARSIYTYSYNEFGEVQADIYLDALMKTCDRLAEQPQSGKLLKTDDEREFRKFPALRHLIIYCVKKDNIEIRRFMHGSMDLKRVLKDL